MAYLIAKKKQLKKAISSLQKALAEPFTDMNRDASIQRFEYTFELFWKTLKIYLSEEEGVECASPKSCFREMRSVLKCEPELIEVCLKMVNDRNFSVHTYSEKMANELYAKLNEYLNVFNKVYALIS